MTEQTEDVTRWMVCDRPWTERCECTDRCAAGCRCSTRRQPPGTMTVRVRDRDRENPTGPVRPLIRTITISAACPVCGGPRGEPMRLDVTDNGAPYTVDLWRNVCGHVDLHAGALAEAAQLAAGRGPRE